MRFHKTKKWGRKRKVILRRDKYMCRHCKRYGNTTQATMVHHIYPVEEFLHLGLINDNLISLCNACHEKMHDRLDNTITVVGKAWQKRVAPPLRDGKLAIKRTEGGNSFQLYEHLKIKNGR